MSDALRATLAHRIPGRVRLRLDLEAADQATLETLADSIAGQPGVRKVEIRPETGSILIVHSGAFETVSQGFPQVGLDVVTPKPPGPVDPVGDTARHLFTADMAVRQASNGKIDLWSAGFLALLTIALWQLGRGRLAGPALTVLGQAATLAMARPYQPPASKPK